MVCSINVHVVYERMEIREDTKEVRAQGGQGDMQQAFSETLETK